MLDDSVVLGDIVYIEFHDHGVINSKPPWDAFEFTAIGKVTNITDTAIVIENWFFSDPDIDVREHSDDSTAGYAIVKGAIKRIRLLAFTDDDPPLKLVS